MLAPDASMTLARAWSDAAFGTMAALCSAYADAVSRTLDALTPPAPRDASNPRQRCERTPSLPSTVSSPSAPARSWYRPPAARPFSSPAFSQSLTSLIPDTWPLLPAMALMPVPVCGIAIAALRVTDWPGAATAFSDWTSPGAWTKGLPAAPTAGSFSTYRSDGGHAVTQITFPNEVVAAIAVPARHAPFPFFDLWRLH